LRPCGDAKLNKLALEWKDFITDKQLANVLKRDLLIQRYGKDHATTVPHHWENLCNEYDATEREVNDRFLAETEPSQLEASQCCYWACKEPDASSLFLCSSCRIVKYCCKDHQAKDWAWEHRGVCRIPQFLKEEMEEDRNQHLAGDFSEVKRN
jgi:hypothetical protein